MQPSYIDTLLSNNSKNMHTISIFGFLLHAGVAYISVPTETLDSDNFGSDLRKFGSGHKFSSGHTILYILKTF